MILDFIDTRTIEEQIYKYQINNLEELENNNYELLKDFIDEHKSYTMKNIQKREDILNNNILYKLKDDVIEVNLAEQITVLTEGYIERIDYSSKNKELLKFINDFLDENGEDKKNSTHIHNMLVKGNSLELIYLNKLNEIRFAVLDPKLAFCIYSNDIEPVAIAGVRLSYLTRKDKSSFKIEVYTNNKKVIVFNYVSGTLKKIEEGYHIFNECPVYELHNNEYHTSDFDNIVKSNQSINKILTQTLKNLSKNNTAPVMIKGLNEAGDDIDKLQGESTATNNGDKTPIIPISDFEMEFKYLQRPLNFEENISFIEKLNEVCNTVSQTIDLVNSNKDISGEALKARLQPLDTKVNKKIFFIKDALYTRFRILLDTVNKLQGLKFNHKEITIVVQKQKFRSEKEMVEMGKIMRETGYDMKTIVTLNPFVQDKEETLKNIEEEKQNTMDEFEKTYLNQTSIQDEKLKTIDKEEEEKQK